MPPDNRLDIPELPHRFRQIAHIGVDLYAWDQAALKAEFLCDGVVVDLVFRGGGEIESVDFLVYQFERRRRTCV